MTHFLNGLEPVFNKIENAMTRRFSSHLPFVNEVSEYILFSGGKRIRPFLSVCSARICGHDGDEAVYDLSVVPEYLHAASLLHDDVIDGGEVRRGKPAAYKVWGNKATVLVGDHLYAKAIELASSFNDVRISKTISGTVALMSEGEIIQLLESQKSSFNEETYYKIIHRKTAALISASCRIGALFAGADDEKVEALTTYGHNLGLVFQIVDDMLDFTADEDELGKSLGKDLSEGKITLPIAHAMAKSSKDDHETLLRILAFENITQEDLNRVCDILEKTGSLNMCRKKAESLINEACKKLSLFPDSATKTLLLELAAYVLKRRR